MKTIFLVEFPTWAFVVRALTEASVLTGVWRCKLPNNMCIVATFKVCGRESTAMSVGTTELQGLWPRADCDVYVHDPCGTYTTQWYLYALWLLRTTLAFGWMSRAACPHVFYVTCIHAGGPNHEVFFIRLRAIAAITRCSVPSLRECLSRCHRVQLVSQLWGGAAQAVVNVLLWLLALSGQVGSIRCWHFSRSDFDSTRLRPRLTDFRHDDRGESLPSGALPLSYPVVMSGLHCHRVFYMDHLHPLYALKPGDKLGGR